VSGVFERFVEEENNFGGLDATKNNKLDLGRQKRPRKLY
jgi:hypothetical protein